MLNAVAPPPAVTPSSRRLRVGIGEPPSAAAVQVVCKAANTSQGLMK